MPDNVQWVLDHFVMSEFLREKLKKVYPTFETEILKIEMWYLANPRKRKRDHYRFIINWLNRIRTEKVKTRNIQDDLDFKEKVEKSIEEAAPPPPEWKEMMERLRRGKT